MDPSIWGPDQWKVLFDVAKVYENCREERDAIGMKVCLQFLFSLGENFMCEHCGYFFLERLSLYNTGTDMVDWIYNLKSLVTNKIHICKENVKHCNVDTLPQVPISRLQFYTRLHFEDFHLESWIRNLILVYYQKESMEFFEISKRLFLDFIFKNNIEEGFERDEIKSPDEFFEKLKPNYKEWLESYRLVQVI